MQGCIFDNLLFLNSTMDLLFQFSITGCNVFFIDTGLKTFLHWAFDFPLWWVNLHVHGLSDLIFMVFSIKY